MEEASTHTRPQTIRLRIRTLRPSTHELTVPAELQVGELKDRLVEVTGVLHERQRLLFAGHALQDDQRLSERGVRDGHTIHLVERLAGIADGPPPPPEGGAMPRQQAPGTAGGMGTQMNWINQLLGGLAGLGHQGADPHTAAGSIPPIGIAVGTMPGQGPSMDGQQQPAMALLSLVQHFIAQLASEQPAAAQPPPATIPYVLPEGRRQDSERRWFTAAQAVLADTELRPEVRRFVETSTASSLAAATAATGSHAGREQARQGEDPRLATTVAVALGEMLRQTGELWRGRAADVLLTANAALSHLDQPIRPGQASDAIAQLQLANAQLFSVGALAWELSRMCSMVLPALSGSAALPLATGRPAFINASGTAPILPTRVQPGLAGLSMLGFGGPPQEQPQGSVPVTVRLPNGALATGHFSGSAPSEAEFLQQLQYILGGQFGLPRPGEGPPRQPAAADGGGGSQARTGRQTAAAAPEQSQPSGSHSAAADTEMPDLVADDGASQYESEWEEAEDGDEDAAAQTRGQGVQTDETGVMPPSPSISITFGNQMNMGGRWPFPGTGMDNMQGFMPTGPAADTGAPVAANAWQSLLGHPRLGAVQQELGRLVCAIVMPILSDLLSQPQEAGEGAEAATEDFVQDLSQRISTALQPSLAIIQRMVQAIVPVLRASASGNAAAASQPEAQATQTQHGAAAAQPSSEPAPATTAAQAVTADRAAPSATSAAADRDGGEQQWAYVPTTTVSAEITVEPVNAAGHPVEAGNGSAGAQVGASQTNDVMAALSASLPAIQQALMDAMRPQQPTPDHPSAPSTAEATADRGTGGPMATGVAATVETSAGRLGTGRPAADSRADTGSSRPAGLGSAGLSRPASGRSSTAQSAAPGGVGVGLGLPPRPAPARRRPTASSRSTSAVPSSMAQAATQSGPGAAAPQAGQLGNMLASMLGGGGVSASGGGGGNFAQMLGQMASSPAMQQLASSPALQTAVQPLLGGGSGASGRQAAQVDFVALMNEMGPVLAQFMGNTGGTPAAGSQGDPATHSAPTTDRVQSVPERPRSAPLPDDAPQNLVNPAVEQVIRAELPAVEAQRWLEALRGDAEDMRANEQRPLSSSYRAGSVRPSSSSVI